MRCCARACAVLAALFAIAAAPSAFAADPAPVPSLDLRGARVPSDPNSGVYVEPADSPGTGEWSVALWASYAYRPVTLSDSKGKVSFDVIRHQMTSDLTGSVGLFNRIELGFDLPVLVYQTGDAPTAASRRALGSGIVVPNEALGDLGLDAKLTMVRPTNGEFGGFALAATERVTLPTGDEQSYLGEGSATTETRLLAEYRLPIIAFQVAGGVKLRANGGTVGCAAVPVEKCPTRFGHELPFGFGVAMRPQALGIDPKGHITAFVETYGYVPIAPIAPFQGTAVSELQLAGSVRYAFGDFSVLGGIERGMVGGVGTPAVRGLASIVWAPRFHDRDGDGIDDEHDQCPDLPEDKDGFQDADGCPDNDNDDDGVPDAEDKCPNEPGPVENHGCPYPDRDKDGIPDAEDACPDEPGPKNPNPKYNGCPDRDHDGIPDKWDKCPDQPEDKDGFEDEDGCPDPDNDKDGIPDTEDACPNVPGVRSANPKENGCPDPDPDHDTFVGAEDKCPNQPEDFNGYEDTDGCPDGDKPGARGKAPLVAVKVGGGNPALEIGAQTAFKVGDPASTGVLRALASELAKHPEWNLIVAVRPASATATDAAKQQSEGIAAKIAEFARRPGSAHAGEWKDVQATPRAGELGFGVLLVVSKPVATEKK